MVLWHSDLPLPPWDGTEAIVPLRTIAEIHAIGIEFRNCLFDDERSAAARFVGDSPLEGAVYCELVSEVKFRCRFR
jgi:hypothetical protein